MTAMSEVAPYVPNATFSTLTRHWTDCPVYDTLDDSDCICYDRPLRSGKARSRIMSQMTALVWVHEKRIMSDDEYYDRLAVIVNYAPDEGISTDFILDFLDALEEPFGPM